LNAGKSPGEQQLTCCLLWHAVRWRALMARVRATVNLSQVPTGPANMALYTSYYLRQLALRGPDAGGELQQEGEKAVQKTVDRRTVDYAAPYVTWFEVGGRSLFRRQLRAFRHFQPRSLLCLGHSRRQLHACAHPCGSAATRCAARPTCRRCRQWRRARCNCCRQSPMPTSQPPASTSSLRGRPPARWVGGWVDGWMRGLLRALAICRASNRRALCVALFSAAANSCSAGAPF
jgi:hypothetical protein